MPDTLTTELEAVNVMLGTIGEAPVNSLSGTLPVDVSTAVSVLKEVRRKVLEKGWHFNTDEEVQSTLDGDGKVIVAQNVLRAEATYPSWNADYVLRGTQLYDRKNKTYVFTQAPTLNLVYLLDWNELPEQARQYIMHRAARIFQARVIGAPELESAATRDELTAKVDLENFEADAANHNIFNTYDMARLHRYRRR